jgi:hypothetical protein
LGDNVTFRRWGLLRRKLGHWGMSLQMKLGHSFLFLLLWPPWGKQLCSITYFLLWCSALTEAQWKQNDGANSPWTETSEIVIQNKPFLPLSWFISGISHSKEKLWLQQDKLWKAFFISLLHWAHCYYYLCRGSVGKGNKGTDKESILSLFSGW